MTAPKVADDVPGNIFFPEFATLYDLIAREVEGLTDAQLDFSSPRWAWAEWSIRRQLSHMAFALYMWLLVRWGLTLFPTGDHGVEDMPALTTTGVDRRLDEERYWDIGVIMQKLRGAIDLAERILAQHSVGYLRHQIIEREVVNGWQPMIQAHATGVTLTDAPDRQIMTLEATFRHLYFEETTHLYNIQRVKRAQGLRTVVEVPRVGYWMLDTWDRSEAG